jgi:protein phosphatase
MNLNPRVGLYYTAGAVLLLAIALLTKPLGWLLLWPTLSMLLVALGYFGLGPAVYGKLEGKHPLWAQVLHWFTIRGHDISRRLYARQCAPWDQLAPGLWIGRQLVEAEAETLREEGITAVLDLTAEFPEPLALMEMHYRSLPMLDLTAPDEQQMTTALNFIAREIEKGSVYVHCKIGYSRTAAIAGSYLIHSKLARAPDEAIAMLRAARPSIVIRPEARAAIKQYATRCHLS